MIKKYLKQRIGLTVFLALFALALLWGYLSVEDAKRNAVLADYEYVPPEGNVDHSREGSYRSVAKTENLELLYNEAKGAVQLKNLKNGYLWKGVADDEVYDTAKLNKQWAAYLKSMLTISYNDLTKRDAPPAKAYSSQDCDLLETQYLDNGVSVRYGFTQPGIYLTVEYLLEDDQFLVRIPEGSVSEESQYVLTAMELLPFLGAAGDEVDGYLVYPDGSGGITRYDKAGDRPGSVKAGMWRAYSNRTVSMEELDWPENYERYVASLPVYGIKNGDNALLAAFTEGAEDCGVVAYPSGYVVNLNHIGFEVFLRNVFDVDMFNVASGVGEMANGKQIQRVDQELIPGSREIRFFLLEGEMADYSGMARTYREYLLETGQLNGVIAENDPMPLALELLMGVTKSSMLMDEYIKMTDAGEVIEILDRLRENGVPATRTVLNGWQKGGERQPLYWPPAGQLGGKKGLEKIGEYVSRNPGSQVFLANDFIFASEENGGFSATRDIVYDGLNLPVTSGTGSANTWYLMNPLAVYERSHDFLDKLEGCGGLGAAYRYMGRIVYPDYNDEAPFTRRETVAQWKKVFADAKDRGLPVAVQQNSQYTFESADYLYDVRENSFGLLITDNSIPFVQMVISGLIPYSTNAGNLSYDLDIQKLKWIECGALPFFCLTYEDAVKLKETGYDSIFTSTFDVWEERVTEVYREFSQNLQCVYGKQMVKHELLAENVARVTYENGVSIILNYGEEEARAEGVVIPSKGYVLSGKAAG